MQTIPMLTETREKKRDGTERVGKSTREGGVIDERGRKQSSENNGGSSSALQ